MTTPKTPSKDIGMDNTEEFETPGNVVSLAEKIEKRSLDKFEAGIALNKLNEAIEKLSCHSEISLISDILAKMETASLELWKECNHE